LTCSFAFQIKYKKNEVVPIKFTSDIHLGFKPVLKKIYNKLPKALFYYLCSDLHLYQEGLITLKLEKNKTKDFTIKAILYRK
jgi:hypothetical protein